MLEDRTLLTFPAGGIAFDFGTDSSPVEPGFHATSPATVYPGADGFGWLDNSGIESRDRGHPQVFGPELDAPAVPTAVGLQVGDRVVFAGDSITATGSSPQGYITRFRDGVERQFPNNEITVLSSGIAGNRTDNLDARFDSTVLSLNPSIVVLFIGINDVWHFGLFGNGTSEADFDQNLRSLIQKTKDANARPILVTPPVIGERHDGTNPLDGRLDDYAQIGRDVAAATGIQVIDLRADFIDFLRVNNPGNVAEGILTTDEVHLNAAGNRFVGNRMLAALDVPAPPPPELQLATPDYNLLRTGSRTFAVDVPNDSYDVSVTVGSAANRRDGVGILLEGQQAGQISTALNEHRTETYHVQVTDGRLDVEVARQGGSAAAINALQIARTRTTISIDDRDVIEGDQGTSTATFNVTLSDDVPGGFTVDYTTVEGTATLADNDFQSTSGQLTFVGNAGESQTISVNVNGDTVDELNERFFVELSNVSAPGVVVAKATGIGQIRDEDAADVRLFDFGAADSPLAGPPNFVHQYERVTPSSLFNGVAGFGWLDIAGIESRNRTGPDDLQRDYNKFRFSGEFAVEVPNGAYEVTVTIGSAVDPRDRVGVILDGTQVDQISTQPGQIVTRTYVTSVTNDRLVLKVEAQGGTTASINALEIRPVRSGVRISDASIQEGDTGTRQLTFDVQFDGNASGPFDVDFATTNGTAVAGQDYTAASGTLTFSGADGETRNVVVDLSGDTDDEPDETFYVDLSNIANTSDQIQILSSRATGTILNDDAAAGSSTNSTHFDFGTATSPVAGAGEFGVDYTQVTPTTAWSPSAGFGWLNTAGIDARARSVPDDLRSDYNLIRSGSMTFAVAVPNGDYNVTVIVGSSANHRDGVGVLLEGTQVSTVNVAAREFAEQTFPVTVSDGRLEVEIARLGSTAASINSLVISEAP